MEIALQRIARIFIALLFLVQGFRHALSFDSTASGIASAGLPLPSILAFITIIVLIACSLLLLFGVSVRYAALTLIIWLTIANVSIHVGPGQLVAFLKNLAIIGGLFALAANE